MAHAFRTVSAKPTFGTVNNILNQGDYLQRKKGILFYSLTSNCNLNCCNKLIRVNNYYNKYLFGSANLINKQNNIPFDKQNLVAGQYTYMDLSGVCCVTDISLCNSISLCPCPCPINVETATEPFYFTNLIDPFGQLFGNTQCGNELNYTQYMRYDKKLSKY